MKNEKWLRDQQEALKSFYAKYKSGDEGGGRLEEEISNKAEEISNKAEEISRQADEISRQADEISSYINEFFKMNIKSYIPDMTPDQLYKCMNIGWTIEQLMAISGYSREYIQLIVKEHIKENFREKNRYTGLGGW